MLTSILIAAAVGGVIAFVWGMISWMALPWHHATYSPFTDEDAVVRAIEANAPVTGVYTLPHWDCGGKDMTPEQKKAKGAEIVERMKRGPIVLAAVVRRGAAGMASYMVRGFLVGVVVSGILAWLLSRSVVVGLLDRALFVGLAGLAGTVAVRLNEWNWHGFSTRYTLLNTVDGFVCWFLAGLGIAAVL